MRTYDKLIATILSGQGTVGLRPAFGGIVATGVCTKVRSPATTQEQTRP